MDCIGEMAKVFERLRYKHDLYTAFEDWLEISAISISNTVDKVRASKREERYLSIASKYSKEELLTFSELLALLVCALERNLDDYLGRLFMRMELNNSWRGQFFTPYNVAYMMARMMISEEAVKEKVEENGVITINDPTVGGGVTLIAAFQTILDLKLNPQKVAQFIGQDIDKRAVFMTYIQLSLIGANAEIYHMDSLKMECYDVWFTPGRILKF